MPNDLAFDPVTKDVIRDGKGSLVKTPTAATMVQHQIWCRFAQWWGLQSLGSLFYNLDNFVDRPEVTVPDEWKRALGVIVARGRIANVQAVASSPRPGRVEGQATMQDISTGQAITAFAKAGG